MQLLITAAYISGQGDGKVSSSHPCNAPTPQISSFYRHSSFSVVIQLRLAFKSQLIEDLVRQRPNNDHNETERRLSSSSSLPAWSISKSFPFLKHLPHASEKSTPPVRTREWNDNQNLMTKRYDNGFTLRWE